MSRRQSLLIAAALLLALTVACQKKPSSSSSTNNTHPAESSTPDQFAAIRPTYQKECKNCHGQTGEGGPVKLEDGTKLKVPSLRDNRAARHPDSDYLKQIQKGGDGMPEFDKKLTPEQMSDLIRMIRVEIQGK